jgi:hypothetical protein
VKPGYFTFFSSARISFGLGIVRIEPGVFQFGCDGAIKPCGSCYHSPTAGKTTVRVIR